MLSQNPSIVDESVTMIKELLPYQVKLISYLVIKYTKRISQFLSTHKNSKSLSKSNLNDLSYLTFSKILFAVDPDAYLNFLNEIKDIPQEQYQLSNFYRDIYNRPKYHIFNNDYTESVDASMDNVSLTSVSYKFLNDANNGLTIFTDAVKYRHNSKKIIPLLCVKPEISISTQDTNKYTDKDPNPLPNSLYESITPDKMTSNFGVGLGGIRCNAYIDLDGVITGIFMYLLNNVTSEMVPHLNDEEKVSITSSGEADVNDYTNFVSKLETISTLGKEDINKLLDEASEEMSKKLFYSLTTVYLATLTKMSGLSLDFIGTLYNDIFNSCRSTIGNETPFDGGRAVSEGMVVRHMAINTSSLLNTIATVGYGEGNDENNIYKWVLRPLINGLFTLKYETYNYIKVPTVGTKHKALQNINNLAKLKISSLSTDNKLDLRCIHETFSPFGISSLFLPMHAIRLNGTYAMNKRYYDAGKDLLDLISKFIIIKKRMVDSSGTNVGDGSVDKLANTYKDYRTYLTETYKELKRALGNSLRLLKELNNISGGPIKEYSKLIYGFTSESNVDEAATYYKIYDENSYDIIDRETIQTDKEISENKTFKDKNQYIGNIIFSINEKVESQLVNKFRGSIDGYTFISKWISYTNLAVYKMILEPFDIDNSSMKFILDKTASYIANTISEATPNVDDFDPKSSSKEFDSWNDSTDNSIYSIESLEKAFENVEKRLEDAKSDEDLFGLFNDFGGIPLGNHITATEDYYEKNSLKPSMSLRENFIQSKLKFEEFKKKYDKVIAKYF